MPQKASLGMTNSNTTAQGTTSGSDLGALANPPIASKSKSKSKGGKSKSKTHTTLAMAAATILDARRAYRRASFGIVAPTSPQLIQTTSTSKGVSVGANPSPDSLSGSALFSIDGSDDNDDMQLPECRALVAAAVRRANDALRTLAGAGSIRMNPCLLVTYADKSTGTMSVWEAYNWLARGFKNARITDVARLGSASN